jgi:hypothetical protein
VSYQPATADVANLAQIPDAETTEITGYGLFSFYSSVADAAETTTDLTFLTTAADAVTMTTTAAAHGFGFLFSSLPAADVATTSFQFNPGTRNCGSLRFTGNISFQHFIYINICRKPEYIYGR